MDFEYSRTAKRDGRDQDDMFDGLNWIMTNLRTDKNIFVMRNSAGAFRIMSYFNEPLSNPNVVGAVLIPPVGPDGAQKEVNVHFSETNPSYPEKKRSRCHSST